MCALEYYGLVDPDLVTVKYIVEPSIEVLGDVRYCMVCKIG